MPHFESYEEDQVMKWYFMIVTAGSKDCSEQVKDMGLANKLEVSETVFVDYVRWRKEKD